MPPVNCVLVGAGLRGEIYSTYGLSHPDDLKLVALAEPSPERRQKIGDAHSIPIENRYSDWSELLDKPRLAELCMICTQDTMHYEPTLAALDKGYHVLVEKPMSNSARECMAMEAAARKAGRILSVCHVLRYTPFYQKIKAIIDEGRIGKVMSITQTENVEYWHQAHSFVRGNWGNSQKSSPMILAKSCHDLDILQWLVGTECLKVSSFGHLSHFTTENAPKGAPLRCLDGCPVSGECPYYAPLLYMTEKTDWPITAIGYDLSITGREKALREGPYGRCVYHCDNDVVDHQIVNMDFEGGCTVSFTMSAFNTYGSRGIKVMGTKGQIRGQMELNEIEVSLFGDGKRELIKTDAAQSDGFESYGHGGGDSGLMKELVSLLRKDSPEESLTSARASLQSHLMCLAAEESRLIGETIDLRAWKIT